MSRERERERERRERRWGEERMDGEREEREYWDEL